MAAVNRKPTYEELERRIGVLEQRLQGLEPVEVDGDGTHAARHGSVSTIRRVFDQMVGIPIQGYDSERRVTYWNSASETVFGYSEDEAIGRKLEDLLLPATAREAAIQDIQKSFDEGIAPPAGEVILTGKDGAPVSVHSSYVTMANDVEGRQLYCIGVDLSERRKTEEALRESEAQKRALLDSSLDSIRLVDKDMRIVWSNRLIEEQVGGDRDEVVGNFCHKVYTGRDKPCPNCPTLKARISGQTEHSIICEENVKGIPGKSYWADYAVPLKDESGEIVRFLQVSRDITDLKKAEAEKEAVIEELKEALSTVKTLRGLLPICSVCKNIRNDGGYWDKLEAYIESHSEAVFSHSICPDCAKKYYPEIELFSDE